jgi:hypothetical protein
MRTTALLLALPLAACTPPPPPMPLPGPYAPYGGAAPSYVAMAPPQQDANGKQFAAPPYGQAALYFVNPTGSGPVLNVLVNGRDIGRLGTQTWMRAEFAPGDHLVRCIGGQSSSALAVYLAPGEIRFIDIEMNPGQPACSVVEAPPAAGRSAVLMGGRAFQGQ